MSSDLRTREKEEAEGIERKSRLTAGIGKNFLGKKDTKG